MRILIPILFLLSLPLAAQQLKVYKQNGVWKYDQSGPLQSYPITGGIVTDTTAIPDPPVVVVPPPTDDTTKIDGRNGTFTGSWTHGVNTPGWYKGTLSYSNVANNTVAYKFQGTKVEFWSERKATHGTGVITIRSGTNVVHSQTVTFVGPSALPVLIYTSPNLTAATNYTIELKVTSGWNLVDFLTIWNYQESTVGPDPIPGNRINVSPTQDVRSIIQSASANTEIFFLPGTFNLSYTFVPSQVSLNSIAGTATIRGTQGSNNDEGATLILKGGSGNQYIKNLTITGNNVSNGGIITDRDNVTIENVRVENHKFFAVWTKDNSGFRLINPSLINNSWSSTGWCSGELMFGGVVSDFEISGGLIQTNQSTRGYAMKILWNDPDVNKLVNGKIHGMRIDLNHFGAWNNGQSRNLSIEIHDCSVEGLIEIYDMIFENQVSLALHKENPGKILIRNSVFKLEGDTYACEIVMNNFEMRECQIYESAMIIANFKKNMKTKNILIDKVAFSSPNGSAMSWGGLVLIGIDGTQNTIVRNSSIDQLPGFPLTRYMAPPQSGVTYESNNTIY